MVRRYILVLPLILAFFSGFGQAKVKKVARPDIPGSFFVDFGFTRAAHAPTNFSQGFWGSRTLNIYYQYPIRIMKSKFSFNPGAGFGFDRFKLNNLYTLNPVDGGVNNFELVDARLLHPNGAVHKSMIVTDYFDIPMDFRFDTRPEDRTRSFSVSLGGRVGVLYDTFTKLKYNEFGESKTIKDKQRHGINPIRYGIYGRIGGGGFNVFMQYNLSPFFKTNEGPSLTKMNSLTIGISIGGL